MDRARVVTPRTNGIRLGLVAIAAGWFWPVASGPGGAAEPAVPSSPSTWLEAQDKTGTTADSEQAVELALRWLAEHQYPNGGWSFDHRRGRCQGQCSEPGTMANAVNGATGLAVLPFICHGNTHASGPYRDNVAAGLGFLVLRLGPDGAFWEDGGTLYSHAMALWALCEDCRIAAETPGLSAEIAAVSDETTPSPEENPPVVETKKPSRNSAVRPVRAKPQPTPRSTANSATPASSADTTTLIRAAATKALVYTLNAQDPSGGGWRYKPRQRGDTSVTGWQVVAMYSATKANFPVPPQAAVGVTGFLNSVQSNYGATYGYVNAMPTPVCSSIGLLCRIYTGWEREQPGLQAGVTLLARQGPSEQDMYYNYYATLVLHHVGGPLWEDWHQKLREYLIRTQSRVGHETGSWSFRGGHGAGSGGRLYSTALACLILETAYRSKSVYTPAPQPPPVDR
ncbi:MAG: hypothetical protein NTY19_15515 [Planctomycetota bacterium]|nr:hypothetical protein [Planctomycetota bacterium]